MLEDRLAEIVTAMEADQSHAEAEKLAELQGSLSALRRISEITAESHYTVIDHREEIVEIILHKLLMSGEIQARPCKRHPLRSENHLAGQSGRQEASHYH